jgi:hypothetical protein
VTVGDRELAPELRVLGSQPAVLFAGVLEPLAARARWRVRGRGPRRVGRAGGRAAARLAGGRGGSDDRAVVLSVIGVGLIAAASWGSSSAALASTPAATSKPTRFTIFEDNGWHNVAHIATGAFLVVVSVRAAAAAVGALTFGARSPRGVRRRGGRRQPGGDGHRRHWLHMGLAAAGVLDVVECRRPLPASATIRSMMVSRPSGSSETVRARRRPPASRRGCRGVRARRPARRGPPLPRRAYPTVRP